MGWKMSPENVHRTRTSRGRGRCKLPRVKFSEALASREHLTPQMRSSPSCASSAFRSPFATPLANDGRGADDDEDDIGVGSAEDAWTSSGFVGCRVTDANRRIDARGSYERIRLGAHEKESKENIERINKSYRSVQDKHGRQRQVGTRHGRSQMNQ